MNPLLAAIAMHRAAQAYAGMGMLDRAGYVYMLRNKALQEARALRALKGKKHVS